MRLTQLSLGLVTLTSIASSFVIQNCQGGSVDLSDNSCHDYDANTFQYQSNAGCVATVYSGTSCTGSSYANRGEDTCWDPGFYINSVNCATD